MICTKYEQFHWLSTPLLSIPDFSFTKSESSYRTVDRSGTKRGETTNHVVLGFKLSSCSFGKIEFGLTSTLGMGTLDVNYIEDTLPKHRVHNLFHSDSRLSIHKETVNCAFIGNDIIVKPLTNHVKCDIMTVNRRRMPSRSNSVLPTAFITDSVSALMKSFILWSLLKTIGTTLHQKQERVTIHFENWFCSSWRFHWTLKGNSL